MKLESPDAAAGTDQRSPDPTVERRRSSLRFGAGIGAVASLPVLAALGSLIRSDWGPNLDEAANAWRSFDQFTGNRVLVGPITQATNALDRPVYDPGPAFYWALAIPTRVAPDAGPLVAAGLLVAVCLVLGCSAAASVGGRRAALVAAAAALTLTATLADQIVVMPIWNPYLPLLPWGASLLVAVAVASGRLGWWPLLVALASYAVQSHLVYAPAVGIAAVAAVAGVLAARRSGRPVGRRWLGGGVVALVVLWTPSLVQQVTGASGNLGLLVRSTVLDVRPTLGLETGLREFGAAIGPIPRWLAGPAPWDLTDTTAGSPLLAVVALLFVAAATALRWRTLSEARRALGLIAVTAGGLAVLTVAGIAQETMLAILYLRYALYPVAMLVLAAAVLLVADAVRGLARRPLRVGPPKAAAPAFGVLAVVALGLGVWLGERTPDVRSVLQGDRPSDVAAGRALRDLLGAPPTRGARIEVALPDPGGHDGVARQLAIGYQLRTRGWTPTIADPDINQLLAPVYRTRPGEPLVALSTEVPAGARVIGQLELGGRPMVVSLRP